MKGFDVPPLGQDERSTVDRILERRPSLVSSAAALMARLPQGSAPRRALFREALVRGFRGLNRGDYWVVDHVYEPDCLIYVSAEWRPLGIEERYQGIAGWHAVNDAFQEFMPGMRWIPEHLIDLGDRWVARLTIEASGAASGAITSQVCGFVYHLSPRGRIARQDTHWTWEDTLKAVGIREPGGG